MQNHENQRRYKKHVLCLSNGATPKCTEKSHVFPIPYCWNGEQWKQLNHSVLNRKTDCCTG